MNVPQLSERLQGFFEGPAATALAQYAPKALLATSVGLLVGAAVALPDFAAHGWDVLLGGLTIDRRSPLQETLINASDDAARGKIVGQGLAQGDRDIATLAAAALIQAGPVLALALRSAERSTIVAALGAAMEQAGGPLATIAPRYTAALSDSHANWPALLAALHHTLNSVTLTLEASDGSLQEGNTQDVITPGSGSISLSIRASGKSIQRGNTQRVTGTRSPASNPSVPQPPISTPQASASQLHSSQPPLPHPQARTVLRGIGTPLELRLPNGTITTALSSVPALPTDRSALVLVFEQERDGFTVLVHDQGRSTRCPLTTTRTSVDELLAYARYELLEVVRSFGDGAQPYLEGLRIPAPLARTSLARLAGLGAYLWQGLFAGPGSSDDSRRLGQRLAERSRAGALTITVAATHLPFPWQLLYDRDPNVSITPDGFWGLRHLLVAQPIHGSRDALAATQLSTAAGPPRALVAFNLGIDASTSPRSVIAEQRQVLASLGIATREANTEHDLAAALAAGSDAELVYVYCHAIAVGPGSPPVAGVPPGTGSTRLVLTDERQALTLRQLQAAAPVNGVPLLRGRPVVILNACSSGALSPLSHDGMAPFLLDLGARAVVGSECDVPILFGAAFGPALLIALTREGLPVRVALRAARRLLLEQEGNILGLLYGLYGDGDVQVGPE